MQKFKSEAPHYLVEALRHSHRPHEINALAEYVDASIALCDYVKRTINQPEMHAVEARRIVASLVLAQQHTLERYLLVMHSRSASNDDKG